MFLPPKRYQNPDIKSILVRMLGQICSTHFETELFSHVKENKNAISSPGRSAVITWQKPHVARPFPSGRCRGNVALYAAIHVILI